MLTEVSASFKNNRQTMVMALCSFCGNIKAVRKCRLDTQKSCGCRRGNRVKGRVPHNKTHGQTKTKLHNVWLGIRRRCNSATDPAYKYYGGKGIKICEAWNDFSIFRDWAYASGYQAGLFCDRINPAEGYRPDNCQWITAAESGRKVTSDIHKHYAEIIAAKDSQIAALRSQISELIGAAI